MKIEWSEDDSRMTQMGGTLKMNNLQKLKKPLTGH